MANAMRPNGDRQAGARRRGRASIEKSPVEARQGERGRRVLIILAASTALLALAYALLFFFAPKKAQAESLRRPILAATRPVVTPRTPPARMSLNQW